MFTQLNVISMVSSSFPWKLYIDVVLFIVLCISLKYAPTLGVVSVCNYILRYIQLYKNTESNFTFLYQEIAIIIEYKFYWKVRYLSQHNNILVNTL